MCSDIERELPGFELFIAPLAVVLGPNDLERVQFAYFMSKFGHAKQTRESGERFFDHPKMVAWIYIKELGGRDPRVVIDALMHDILEDSYIITLYRISRNLGEEIALDIRALTKLLKKKEKIEEYLRRIIERGPWTILTKLCDRLHNSRTLGARSLEKIKEQIAETREHILPLLIPALKSYGGEWALYAEKLEGEINKAILPYLV